MQSFWQICKCKFVNYDYDFFVCNICIFSHLSKIYSVTAQPKFISAKSLTSTPYMITWLMMSFFFTFVYVKSWKFNTLKSCSFSTCKGWWWLYLLHVEASTQSRCRTRLAGLEAAITNVPCLATIDSLMQLILKETHHLVIFCWFVLVMSFNDELIQHGNCSCPCIVILTSTWIWITKLPMSKGKPHNKHHQTNEVDM